MTVRALLFGLAFLSPPGVHAGPTGAETTRAGINTDCQDHESMISACFNADPQNHAQWCEQNAGHPGLDEHYCDRVVECHEKHPPLVQACGNLVGWAHEVNETGRRADEARGLVDHRDGTREYDRAIEQHGAAIGNLDAAQQVYDHAHGEFTKAAHQVNESVQKMWPDENCEACQAGPDGGAGVKLPSGVDRGAAKASAAKVEQAAAAKRAQASKTLQTGKADQAKHQAAAQNYKTLLAANPSDPKKLAAAREFLDGRLKENPNDASALRMRAMDNFQRGDCSAATADAGAALRQNPNDKKAMGINQLCGGSSAGMAVKPELGAAGKSAADLGVSGSDPPPRAAAAGSNAAVLSSGSGPLVGQAAFALRGRDFEKALAYAKRAIELDPSNVDAWRLSASARLQMKDYKQAAIDAAEGLKLHPKDKQLLAIRAFAQNREKDYKGALETADAAIAADPNDAGAWRNRAYALAGLGDRKGMLEALRKAAALDARFERELQAALRLPDPGDAVFLFLGDEHPDGGLRQEAPARGLSPVLIAVSAVLGGLLIVFGSSSFFGEKRSLRVTPMEVLSDDPELLDGKYEILGRIGAGSQGLVFEGVDRSRDRKVAIKKIAPRTAADPQAAERFIAQATTAASLHHPNIVDIYSIAQHGGEIYLIYEFVQGKTLGDIAAAKEALPFAEASRIVLDIAEALEFAHNKGVLHGALKLSNVMIDEQGTVKVTDFGMGQGEASRQSDIQALAVCLDGLLGPKRPSGLESLFARAAGFSSARELAAALGKAA